MTVPGPTGGHRYIHYDPDRTDYAITNEELMQLEAAGASLWKDLCLVCLPLGVGCLINAIASTPAPFDLSLSLFLNYLFGILGIALGIAFALAWKRTHTSFRAIVNAIKQKPRMQLTLPVAVDVGALPVASVSPAKGGSVSFPASKPEL